MNRILLTVSVLALAAAAVLHAIDASLLDDDELYIVRMRVYLDFDELPLPLRIRAYSTSAWRPDSGWKVWPLH